MNCRNHGEVTEGVQLCTGCRQPFCADCMIPIEGRLYCGECKRERILDVLSGVDSFSIRFAGGWKRFGAMLVDGVIVNTPMYALMIFLAWRSPESPLNSYISIPFMFIYFIYEGLMTQFRNGQTLGRMALKIRIVRPDGSPISSKQAWGRAALRLVLGCLSFVDYLFFFFTKEKTTLHDMMAGTRVVDAS